MMHYVFKIAKANWNTDANSIHRQNEKIIMYKSFKKIMLCVIYEQPIVIMVLFFRQKRFQKSTSFGIMNNNCFNKILNYNLETAYQNTIRVKFIFIFLSVLEKTSNLLLIYKYCANIQLSTSMKSILFSHFITSLIIAYLLIQVASLHSLQVNNPNKDFQKLQIINSSFIGTREKDGSTFPIYIINKDDSSFNNTLNNQKGVIQDAEQYDVVVVGAGLSGLTASVYLTDKQKTVLLIDRQRQAGGLASYGEDSRGFFYDRGASYWTKAYPQQLQIEKRIGLGNYRTQNIIEEPIDTYLWRGVLYGAWPHKGVWDDRVIGMDEPKKYNNGTDLPILPASFGIFRQQILAADDQDLIPDQPFQLFKKLYLDTLTAQKWIRKMPNTYLKRISRRIKAPLLKQNHPINKPLRPSLNTSSNNVSILPRPSPLVHQIINHLSKKKNPKKVNVTKFQSKLEMRVKQLKLWEKFQSQIKSGQLNKKDPMFEVIDFLEQYSRSALGTTLDKISAMAFANFYVSQVQPRYTSPFGTALAAKNMMKILQSTPRLFRLKVNSTVWKIANTQCGVTVNYVENGVSRSVKAKNAIYAAQMGFAPNIIQGLDEQSTQQAKAMRNLKYAHYSVHIVQTTNHPYRAAYDTWVNPEDNTLQDFTDLIVGRWVQLQGYSESDLRQNYRKNPDQKGSVYALYHPLIEVNTSNVNHENSWYSDENAARIANRAVNRMDLIFKSQFKQNFTILNVNTNRWPYSIHIPEKNHFKVKVPLMAKTFGNIIFGNNNLGTPSFQEALFRGHCAANKALLKLIPGFVQEIWSKCSFNV